MLRNLRAGRQAGNWNSCAPAARQPAPCIVMHNSPDWLPPAICRISFVNPRAPNWHDRSCKVRGSPLSIRRSKKNSSVMLRANSYSIDSISAPNFTANFFFSSLLSSCAAFSIYSPLLRCSYFAFSYVTLKHWSKIVGELNRRFCVFRVILLLHWEQKRELPSPHRIQVNELICKWLIETVWKI